MKKIDFHLHTLSTPSDNSFEFCLDTLVRYVKEANLDSIAITNHNTFNKDQYLSIVQKLDIKVFPGIEIDVDRTHLLVISDDSNLSEFESKCVEINRLIPDENGSITTEKLIEIFSNLSEYIVIPHYKKHPEIQDAVLSDLSMYITAGEVSAPKKFIHCMKDKDSLVPVLFSDARLGTKLNRLPTRQTFVDIGDISLESLKLALSDKQKVYLTKKDGHKFFNALSGQLSLSTGLNVIVGERSTGKSFTLDQLAEENSAGDSRVKYIKQFDLLQKDTDDKEFSRGLETTHSRITSNYLKPFEEVVEQMHDVNLEKSDRSLASFIDSLLKNATEADKHDSYAKAKLFSETKYSINELTSLEKIISATAILLENTEYQDIIHEHITAKSLKALILHLITEYNQLKEIEIKKSFVNNIVEDIKNDLSLRTAATPIHDIDFYAIALEKEKVRKFNQLFNEIKKVKEFKREEIQGFIKVAVRRPFENATDVGEVLRKKLAYSSAYEKYNDTGYEYLKQLRNVTGLDESNYYRLFTKISYDVLNSQGYTVSGGERSEFRLLEEISDASQYDLLLIDEPESSFDNIFLQTQVNKLIKEISSVMPVVIVTHNSTVGASIQPDYLIYTSKSREQDGIIYKLFTGYPGDKILTSNNGEKTENHKILMDCLEAGDKTYEARRSSYEMLKD